MMTVVKLSRNNKYKNLSVSSRKIPLKNKSAFVSVVNVVSSLPYRIGMF